MALGVIATAIALSAAAESAASASASTSASSAASTSAPSSTFTWSPRALAQDSVRRSSADSVYTLDQANRGRDIFASACQSCHTPTVHSGPPFRARWFGRTLGDLFGYLKAEMPKADPGSMSDEEYALVIAYLLRINGMPTGSAPLAMDSVSLHRIRLDSVPRTGTAR